MGKGLLVVERNSLTNIGRRNTEEDIEPAWLCLPAFLLVIEFQSLAVEGETESLLLACLEIDLGKALELLDRTLDRTFQIAHIELDNLCTFDLACVGHIDCDCCLEAVATARCLDLGIIDLEGGV